jgi:hypothetical protein
MVLEVLVVAEEPVFLEAELVVTTEAVIPVVEMLPQAAVVSTTDQVHLLQLI